MGASRASVRAALMSASTRSSSVRLSPFSPEERPRVIAELVDDAEVQAAAAAETAASNRPLEIVLASVRTYADEIVPDFRARLHHRLAHRLARQIATALFRVRVGHVDATTLTGIPADTAVVFVINHRSNIDYVLVAFLVAEHVALSFAAGEWARIWPLDTLVRSLGAFFVRRDSRNPLYRKVLERYVQLAVAHGVTQGIFLEGGLSRDGRLRPPKYGLLGYLTRRMSRSSPRDVVFVPVAVNYDRVLEDRNLLLDLDPGAVRRSKLQTALSAATWIAKNVGLYVRGRLHRFGYACVNFGAPFSLRRYLDQRAVDFATLDEPHRLAETERLGAALMDEVAQVVPVTPVSLVATALLSFEGATATRAALAARATALVEELESVGAHLYVPRRDPAYMLEVGLRMLVLRRLVTKHGDTLTVVAAERPLLTYYANSIEHFFATRHTPAVAASGPHARRSSPRAVVLVHGLARTSRSMARLAAALEAAAYEVHNWDYPSREYGVMALVEALGRYVRTVAADCERVDFVTHSMGGLLARGVLARRAVPNVGRLVMLAPPNRGALLASRVSRFAWAREFFGQALDDQRADRALNLDEQLGPVQCEFGVIAGTRSFHPLQPTSYYSSLVRRPGSHDGTVQVEETRLAGMADFVTVEANHTFIMDHDDTIRQVLAFLERGRFDRPAVPE